MNPKVREVIKALVRERAKPLYVGIDRRGVTVALLQLKLGKQVYTALGTAKWMRSDSFDPNEGINLAIERAIVELVDLVLTPTRRMNTMHLTNVLG